MLAANTPKPPIYSVIHFPTAAEKWTSPQNSNLVKRMEARRSLFVFVWAFICTSVGFGAGFLLRGQITPDAAGWQVLAQAYEILQQHGLKETPAGSALEYGMIRGMLQAYDDPYTIFVEPAQHELETNTLEGSFGGIGVRLGRDSENYPVLYPFPESPAAEAGVQEGDRLVRVDDLQITAETSTETIQSAVRGPVNQRVRITVQRPPDYQEYSFEIRRAEIPLPSVTWHLDSQEARLGVIEVNVIAASTPGEVLKAAQDLQGRGATALVLDLRDNFGGLLTTGVDTARLFLRQGIVIEQQYKGKAVETYRVEKPGPLAEIPLAILINQHTASAAEIIAGALQAQGRARLVGSRSFGKDTIQLVFNLQDESSLHVTSAKWWVPDLDTPLGGSGLQPDILVEGEPAADQPDATLQAAAELLFAP